MPFRFRSLKTFVSKIIHYIKNPLSVSSKIYALSYLACIPLFATIYTYLLPGQFYHPTVSHEASLIEDRKSICEGLSKAITRMYNKNVLLVHPDEYGWRLNSEQIEVSSLNVLNKGKGSLLNSDNRILFGVGMPLKNKRTGATTVIDMVWELQLVNVIEFVEKTEHGDFTNKFFTINEIESWNFKIKSINLSFLLGDHPSSKKEYILQIPTQLEAQIFDFVRGMEGFPARIKYNYWRMLYFSIVTITTLGFGDIVPVTMPARMVVVSEAVFGVVLIGLFLSALANEIKKGKDTEK